MKRVTQIGIGMSMLVVLAVVTYFKSAYPIGCEEYFSRIYNPRFPDQHFHEESDTAFHRSLGRNDSKRLKHPVTSEDRSSDLRFKQKLKETKDSNWWQAAASLERDFRKRPKDYNCKDVQALGNWFGCFDKAFKLRKPCLVYSFGIANDFTFDDAMAKKGCEVHSFDPSMGKPHHMRANGVHFHPIGIGGKTIENFHPRRDVYVKEEQSWTVMTLRTIMALLGHDQRQLDILKIDVEGHEWNVVEYLLEHNLTSKINQLLIEYHLFPGWPAKSEYKNCLKVYKALHDRGYNKFFTHFHTIIRGTDTFRLQADVAYVNMGNKTG